MIRGLWRRWCSHGLIDEFARIEAIKGQRAANVLTAVRPRRQAVADAPAGCPAGEWVDVDDLFATMRRARPGLGSRAPAGRCGSPSGSRTPIPDQATVRPGAELMDPCPRTAGDHTKPAPGLTLVTAARSSIPDGVVRSEGKRDRMPHMHDTAGHRRSPSRR